MLGLRRCSRLLEDFVSKGGNGGVFVESDFDVALDEVGVREV